MKMSQTVEGQLEVAPSDPRDIRINFPDVIVHRVTKPFGEESKELWPIYRDTFPIKDEREPKRKLQAIARGLSYDSDGRHVESYLVSTTVLTSQAAGYVGGNVFDYVQGRVNGRDIPFGIDWFLFVDRNFRRFGLGTLTHDATLQILQNKAAQRGHSSLDVMACELNDPNRMTEEEKVTDRVVMDPTERLVFWNGLGYRSVDPNKFRYTQPQLTKDTDPYEGLMLCIKPVNPEIERGRIPIEYLKQLLRLYTWAGFEGIPGSDMDGYRNPDTDKTYQDMKRQLELLERKTSYLPLVTLVSPKK